MTIVGITTPRDVDHRCLNRLDRCASSALALRALARFQLCAALALAGCSSVSAPDAQPDAAGSMTFSMATSAAGAIERPFGGKLVWRTDSIRPVAPSGDPLFGGRCSVASVFVEYGHFVGEIMHGGLIEATGIQCVHGTPLTGLGVTDAIDTFTTANGDKLVLRWAGPIELDNGMFIVNASFTVTGGTGRFAGATGQGILHGEAHATPKEVLAGTPVIGWIDGFITYSAGRRRG